MPVGPLTVREAAQRCRVSPECVSAWLKRGVQTTGGRVWLRGWKAGRQWRIDPAALEEFLKACSPSTYREQAEAERAHDERVEAAMRRAGWK